ncbi:MAG TPA: type II secretion system protein N, partial [Burkholderiales bacterium]|nr:type II secretion system protein N [Burkholderiales bacterium]
SPDRVALIPQSGTAVRQSLAETIAADHVFGGGKAVENARLPPGLWLEGVLASKEGEPAAAIFSEAGKKSRVVLLEEEVSPGFHLEEVAADHVVLRHGGGRTTMKLRQIAPELDLGPK